MSNATPEEAQVLIWSRLITLAISFVPGYLKWKRKRHGFWVPLMALPVMWYVGTLDVVQWLVVAWWFGKPALFWDGSVVYATASTQWFDWFASAGWLAYGGVTVAEALEPAPPPADEPPGNQPNQGD